MTFPSVVEFSESNGDAGGSGAPFNADTSCFLDAEIGELLLLWFFLPTAGNVACRPPNEGTEWFGHTGRNQNAGAQVFHKYADGSEGATTPIVTHNGSTKPVFVRAERYGASAHFSTVPVGDFASGYDAPSLNPSTWDSEDTLWHIAACSTVDAGSVPSGWESVWEPQATIILAKKEENVSFQDPATTGGSNDGVILVTAIRPSDIINGGNGESEFPENSMIVTNILANYIMFGSTRIAPGGSATISDALYATDDLLASQINSADLENNVTVSSPPSGYPRTVNSWWLTEGSGDEGGEGDPIVDPDDYIAHVLADNPRLYWPADEASGHLIDRSGNGLDSTTETSIGYQGEGPLSGGDDFGLVVVGGGNARRAIASTATNNITMEIWVLPAGMTSNGCMFQNGDASSGYAMLWSASNKMSIVLFNVGVLNASTATFPLGQWAYLVAKRTANVWSYLINGVVSDASVSSAAPVTPATTTAIGTNGLTANTGFIAAHAAIYETAISDGRIAERYALAIGE
jgi:concanavalin A-like lectin/glucanase superfamily protein